MPWRRLYIVVEGQAEHYFVENALRPHFVDFEIDVRTLIIFTNRRLGMRGGLNNFDQIRRDIVQLLRQERSPETRFTTMVDLYALPREFPGWTVRNPAVQPIDRVLALETAFAQNISDDRFIPYIQLHEYEALLYCDLNELEVRIEESRRGLESLRAQVAHLRPEDINEGAQTAPSKRLIQLVPAYERQKVRVGGPAAVSIGLPRLRQNCPHFDGWITHLEALGTAPGREAGEVVS